MVTVLTQRPIMYTAIMIIMPVRCSWASSVSFTRWVIRGVRASTAAVEQKPMIKDTLVSFRP